MALSFLSSQDDALVIWLDRFDGRSSARAGQRGIMAADAENFQEDAAARAFAANFPARMLALAAARM